jgi:rod shape-determining protein MreC
LKGFFRNRAVIALFIAALVILAMAVSSIMFEGEASPLADAIRVIMTPFRAAASGISNFISSGYSYIYESEELKAENDALKVKIAQMEEKTRQSEQALEENERLRKLLDLSERRRDFKYVMAEIVSKDASNWASTFTIGKGSAQGIEPFDCVVNEQGYVAGYVSEVGTNWSIDDHYRLGRRDGRADLQNA